LCLPSYYDDVRGDDSECVDNRFLSVAVYGKGFVSAGAGLDRDANGNLYWAGSFTGEIEFSDELTETSASTAYCRVSAR